MTDYITFEGKKYPIRELRLSEYDVSVRVSCESLREMIYDENGDCTSRDAQLLSEIIFFYVPDELADGTDDEIAQYIYDHLEW